jgi:uncharacterized protein (UPF0212 family)
MAYLKQAKTEDEIKKLTVANVKKAYNELARDYNKIIEQDYILCPKCGEFISRENFYSSNEYPIGVFPQCKKCILAEVEQRTKKTDKPNETKDSVKRMLQKMNLPYIDDLYESACKTVADEVNEKNRKAPFLAYLVPLKSLPQYKNKTWSDSEFELGVITEEEETKISAKTIKSAKKRFGSGYSNEDLMFLENEYQDWTTRYACENKAQELLFKRICFKELEIDKAQKNGKDTKELDKTLQELMGSLSVKPSQSNSDSLADFQTFGQLIAKWEDEKPIPEPDEEFRDVDKIGLYIDVFFKGHLSKMMGLKNAFSSLYERFISKYTVSKPQYDEDVDSEVLFDQIFGSKIDEE